VARLREAAPQAKIKIALNAQINDLTAILLFFHFVLVSA
jgi:hypothetical protein